LRISPWGEWRDASFIRAGMVDYLLHIYRKGSKPFQTLSDLPEEMALQIMEQLYMEVPYSGKGSRNLEC
jgi:hypothetical protein